MQTIAQILENKGVNTSSRTTSTGLSDDLVVLFKGRIYPHDKLKLVEGEVDTALKTTKFCKSCTGLDSCKNHPLGWQAFYDENSSRLYGFVYPCFRYKQCQYWHEERQNNTVKPRYQKRNFDTFKITAENADAYEICQKCAEKIDHTTTKGILLTGTPGTGKTHLVVSIHRAVLKKGIASVFINMSNLVNELLQSFKSGEESLTYMAALEKRLVIIDDLGAERLRDWVQEYIYRLINERYEKMLPLVVTTNCGIKELDERIGGPAVDRLAEMCEIVPLEGKSWRRRRA